MSDAADVRDIALASANGIAEAKNRYAVLPDGFQVYSLEDMQPQPNRLRASPEFRTAESLAAYVKAYGDTNIVAFAHPDDRRVDLVLGHSTAVADQHHDHKPALKCVIPPEFAAWNAINGKGVSQVDAGIFLEDRAADVVDPDAATIMDTVLAFDALKKVTFKSSTRLHDGRRQFTYNEENESSGNVKLPETLTLLLPVFEGQEPERIKVRVRYRINDGALRFQFDIADRERLFRNAFDRSVDAVAHNIPEAVLTYCA